MARLATWILVVLLLGGFAAAAYVALRERAASGRGMPDYSVFSEGDDGLGEAAHVLRQAGWTPVAVTRPIARMEHRGLLIVVGPRGESVLAPQGGLTEADARGLLRWVEQGNTLLFCSNANSLLHRLLGVYLTQGPRDEDRFTAVDLAQADSYTEEIERLSVTQSATVQAPAAATVLWRLPDRQHRAGAVVLPRGKGQVIVVADPGLLTRRGLVRIDGQARDDNVVFLRNVTSLHARGGKVFFDEYHHGFRSGGGFWGYLAYHGQRWTLLPVLFVVAVAAWGWAVRLGPAVPRAAAQSADVVNHATALARLYQRAGRRRLLARTLVRDFLDALTQHLHLRRTALPALILAAWRQQETGRLANRLQELLKGVVELRKQDVGERRMLHWARAFDQFTREMRSPVPGRKPGRRG
jgi:hypothetical protein